MRLVEAVVGEFFHQTEHFIGDRQRYAAFARTGQKTFPLRSQNVMLLFAHRPAQQIGLPQSEAAHDRSDLHDLFLIKDHAESIAQNRFQHRMLVYALSRAMATADKVLDHAAVQRTRTVQRHQGNQVVKPFRPELLDQVGHPRRFHLKHADGLATRQHRAGGRVFQRNGINVDVYAAMGANQIDRIANHRQRPQSQQIHLQEADLFDAVFVELGRDKPVG